MISHYIHVIFLRQHYLLYTYLSLIPTSFFVFHQIVRKPFKFINNSLQAIQSLVNELNFPSFLYLFVYSFSANAWESKQFLYKYQYQCILIFSVIWLGIKWLKYRVTVFNTDMGIQMM